MLRSFEFMQDFLDHYVDQCLFNDVHVGCSHIVVSMQSADFNVRNYLICVSVFELI